MLRFSVSHFVYTQKSVLLSESLTKPLSVCCWNQSFDCLLIEKLSEQLREQVSGCTDLSTIFRCNAVIKTGSQAFFCLYCRVACKKLSSWNKSDFNNQLLAGDHSYCDNWWWRDKEILESGVENAKKCQAVTQSRISTFHYFSHLTPHSKQPFIVHLFSIPTKYRM